MQPTRSNPTVRAVIHWRERARGGRLVVPNSGYRTVGRFDADPDWQKYGSFTLVFEDLVPVDGSRVTLANVTFLVDDAPHHLLADEGAQFEVMEGPNPVARGVLLGEVRAMAAA